MVENVLKRISEAEAKAESVLSDAEKTVRKIEERNYADIEKMQIEINLATTKEVKAIEQEAMGDPVEGAVVSLAAVTKEKIKTAKDYIVNAIIGGLL